MQPLIIGSVVGARVEGGCWAGGAEQGLQVHTLVRRYCTAFKSPEHYACTYPEQLFRWQRTPRLVMLRVRTGQGYLAA